MYKDIMFKRLQGVISRHNETRIRDIKDMISGNQEDIEE